MNTMGAFFSGTDDNNDKTGIYYSGVVGKITDNAYEWTMRFNLHDHKTKVDLKDIFEMNTEVTIPSEWLDQVEVQTHQGYQGTNLSQYGQYFRDRMQVGATPQNPAKWSPNTPAANKTSEGGASGPAAPMFPDMEDVWGNMAGAMADNYEGSVTPKNVGPAGTTQQAPEKRDVAKKLQDLIDPMGPSEVEEHDAKLTAWLKSVGQDPDAEPDTAVIARGAYMQSENLETLGEAIAASVIAAQQGQDDPEEQQDPVGPRLGSPFPENTSPFHEEFLMEFGKTVADTYSLVDSVLPELQGCDKGLLDIIRTAYHMLSEDGQMKLQTNGF